MGFLKKLKDTTEQGVGKGVGLGKKDVEKCVEDGTKVYDETKDTARSSIPLDFGDSLR
jgi:hypothetical protein